MTETGNKTHLKINSFTKGQFNLYLIIESKQISGVIFSKNLDKVFEITSMDFDPGTSTNETDSVQFKLFLNEFELLKHQYAHVSVQIINSQFTISPETFIKTTPKDLLEFNLGEVVPENINTEKLPGNLQFIFQYPLELKNEIVKTFPAAHINHSGCTTINLLLNSPLLRGCDVFVNQIGSQMEIAVRGSKKLLFYNVFPVSAEEDFLYFLLYTIEQLKLDPYKLKLGIASNEMTTSHMYKTLRKYIKHMDFVKSNIIDKPIENLPNHYFFNLLNRRLCE